MADVLFCTKNDIVRKSQNLDGNIDADLIIPSLHITQTQNLRGVIGTDLYNKLTSEITAGTLANPYLSLLNNYIKPILIHLTLAEFFKGASIKVTNKGVYKHTSENATEASSEEIKDLIQMEKDRAESYKQRFLDHMSFNASASYPEWFSNSNEDVSPQYESFNTDWVL